MSERAICSECGASMLATTAARTGGVCMACKKAIRNEIEEAKERYKLQLEGKVIREHWDALEQRIKQSGLEALSIEEQNYYVVSLFAAEVENGGFDQYFCNPSGDQFRATVRGLEALQAWHSRRLLLEAAKVIFGEIEVPFDEVARRRIQVGRTTDDTWRRLDELDRDFYMDRDGLHDRLKAYGSAAGWFT
jgi:hypothetical protein